MLALKTLEEDGSRPDSRIGSSANARSLINRLKYEDDTRMWRHTRIMGLLDGNPPWPASKLRDIGQAHRANFNLREGEGIVDAAKTPYYDLVFEVPQFAQVTFELAGADPQLNKEWSDIFSEEYHELLCDWSSFDQLVQLHQWQMIVNGVGPVFWPHSLSWQSEALKSRKVLVPQETRANTEQLEMCAVLHSYRADELERYTKNEGAADGQGWNVPLVRDVIIKAATNETRAAYGNENYDLYQRAIRSGDLYYGINRSERIYVASLFIREFGGKVSHYMVTDQYVSPEESSMTDPEQETGYLFKKRNKFGSFSEVLCPFFYDTGPDGTWHCVKGLGPKIFDFCDVSNRTFCQMLDGAVIGAGITLLTKEGAALEKTQLALIGGATVVAPGYDVAQTRIAESLNGAMAMRRELQNTLQSNTGSYRQRVAEEARQEPTLGQAQMNYQQQALLSKGATNRYYNNLDKWHRETIRRLLDSAAQSKSVPGGVEAQRFIARCVTRGLPEEILKYANIKKVYSVRSLGYGSPQLRDMATKELITLVPLMDEQSRNHALRARAAALPGIGMAQVDSFFPKIEKAGVPNAHTSYATTENNALRSLGGQALVEPGQNDSIHFDTHMQDVQQHLQDPNAQQDPGGLLIHLEQAGGHMAQHLERLKGDPTRKEEVDQKKQALDQIAKITDKLGQNLQEQATAIQNRPPEEGNGQQPQMDPDSMVKLLKVQGEHAIKTQKAAADTQLKIRQADQAERLADARTAAEIKRADIRTREDIRAARLQEAATGGKAGGGKIPP